MADWFDAPPAATAGARTAGYVLLRLPLEIKELFEEWLEEGHRESFASHDVDSLLDALPQSTPPRAVAIVAALARRASPGREAARTCTTPGAGIACGGIE